LLEIWLGDQRWQFDDGPVVIGRADDTDVRVEDARVSRHHLEARLEAGSWRVRDLESSNGTFLERQRVTEVEVVGVVELSLADEAQGARLRFGSISADAVTVIPTARQSRVLRIGRALDNDLVLDDAKVSRYHAELVTRSDGQYEIRDCGSANGVTVDGQKTDHATVGVDTRLEIGDATLRIVPTDQGGALELVARGVTEHPSETGTRGSAPAGDPAAPDLTARERELLAFLAGGATDRQIADELFISIATVRSHLDRIQQKTGRRRRADLTRLALEIGVDPRSPARG
jgi:pSer/pThr/pTyr-binding forkhead associated (FHA) protein/DNA-binding CsgD family transcriptional regulator